MLVQAGAFASDQLDQLLAEASVQVLRGDVDEHVTRVVVLEGDVVGDQGHLGSVVFAAVLVLGPLLVVLLRVHTALRAGDDDAVAVPGDLASRELMLVVFGVVFHGGKSDVGLDVFDGVLDRLDGGVSQLAELDVMFGNVLVGVFELLISVALVLADVVMLSGQVPGVL